MSTLLFVDDEPNILQALQRLFADEDDIEVRTAESAAAALEVLAAETVDLVVSDKMMPVTDGVELLAQIRAEHPDMPLMLLTGYAAGDNQDVIDKLGEELPIINKPWDGDALRASIGEVLFKRSEDQEVELLLEHCGVTQKQLGRAERVRGHMESSLSIGQVLIELGELTQEDYDKVVNMRRTGMSLVALLREDGVLSEEGLAEYNEARDKTPDATDRILLVTNQLVSEEQFLHAVSAKHDIPYIEPEVGEIDERLLTKTSIRYLQRHASLPLKVLDGKLQVILADPLDHHFIQELERIFGRKIAPACCVATKIDEALRTLDRLRAGRAGEAGTSLQYRVIDELQGEDGGEEAVQIVDYLLLRAIQLGASDLHIEPQQNKIRVRTRIDGVLQHLTDLPGGLAPRLASRIKILAGADIAEKRLHQDGKIFVKVEGSEVDIRVSVYASIYGETLVMRLLDRNRNLVSLDQIGFAPRAMGVIEEIVLKTSSGLVLMTGPTGSGKTTTLYSFVDRALDPAEKVITCEDPVEYVIEGVTQCSVNSKTGPTFHDSLRAIVRQDPDTIVVGEIRDPETANLALESALTGHKVYSTFHTEDAVSVLIRLLDMDVEPFLASSTVSAIIAQRLLRRLCPNCKTKTTPTREELRFLGIEKEELRGAKLFGPNGCGQCSGSGYKGRMGIHEVLIPDDDFRDAILKRYCAKDLREIARRLPEFLTLQEDALLKVGEGHTTLQEVVSNAPRDIKCRDYATLRKVGGYGRKG